VVLVLEWSIAGSPAGTLWRHCWSVRSHRYAGHTHITSFSNLSNQLSLNGWHKDKAQVNCWKHHHHHRSLSPQAVATARHLGWSCASRWASGAKKVIDLVSAKIWWTHVMRGRPLGQRQLFKGKIIRGGVWHLQYGIQKLNGVHGSKIYFQG